MKNVAETLKVECTCGKRVLVPRHWAGKRARCPKCKQPIEVPSLPASGNTNPLAALAEGEAVLRVVPVEEPRESAHSAISDTITPRGAGPKCPSCGQHAAPGAKICVQCGVDLKTGRSIQMRDDAHLDAAYINAERVIRPLSFLCFFGFYPIASEAFGTRKPWVARGVALLTVCISVWFMAAYLYSPTKDSKLALWMLWSGDLDARIELQSEIAELEKQLRESGELGNNEELQAALTELRSMEVGEFRWYQPLTCAFLHADLLHLAGNMLFLMIFGSRVNMLIGNVLTVICYVLLAYAAGLAHDVASRDEPLAPMLGASGAVMGLAGMYLVLFPVAKVHMAVWWRWGLAALFKLHMNIFPMRGFWVVLFYIAFDVVYTYFGIQDNVAHSAHLGGFIGGVALAAALLFARVVNARGNDLFSVALGTWAWNLIGKPNAKRLSIW